MVNKNKYIKYIVVTLIWLLIWEVVCLILNNSILLASPVKVIITLLQKSLTLSFWKSIGFSMLRIAIGFTIGVLLGLLLGIGSYKWGFIEDLLKPVMAFLKAAPVASFIVLFLIWWHSDKLSMAICICVVMPQIYVNLLQGLKSTDKKLLEMADVYNLHPFDRLHYIYRPAVKPFLEGAFKIAATTAWKASIAAEVIGTPDFTIGESLYMSKIYLDTAGVLAWTTTIIICSVICEKVLLILFDRYNQMTPVVMGSGHGNDGSVLKSDVVVSNLSKSYGDMKVLDGYSARFDTFKSSKLNWPSGAGKTTLLRILTGLDKDYEGSISGLENKRIAMLFQEDRLCEDYSAMINVELVCGSKETSKDILLKLLSEEDIYKPVNMLSGGQRRRVAVARLLAANADVMLVDEPFNGLDELNRKKVNELIDKCGRDKICIIASHITA